VRPNPNQDKTIMAQKAEHKIAAHIRSFATKLAAEKAAADGSPDRMTVADGQGGITTHKGTIPTDPGEADLKDVQPADGKGRQAPKDTGSPDRMTVADGQGGITASKGTIPTDPGEADLKADQPTDGVSKRASRIRDAIVKANPALGAKIQKQAGNPVAARPVAQIDKQAGNDNPSIDLSESTLAKIASAILSTDEGVRFVHDTLEKQAGENAARIQIQEAIAASQVFDYTEQVKSAAFDDLGHKVVEIHNALQSAGVTENDADEILKQAAYHQEKMASLEQFHPLLKQAYAQGMDDAALLAAADDAGGEEGMPPVEEAMPMGGEDLGEEEILALIEEMLASGQITEDDIMQAVAATGGGAEGGELGAEMGAEALPEEGLVPA
jgi:hypothetical protein